MLFGGFQKSSLLDFPDQISSILFSIGCNLRCPFCYNGRLIQDIHPPFITEKEILRILNSRKKYVDAVVITGGEPTMNKDLPIFVEKLKKEGYAIKLDTNGFYPEVLKKCIPYLKYVAMDVKTSLKKYSLLGANYTKGFLNSIEILKERKIDYEFRCTVVPGIVQKEDIFQIGENLRNAKRFALQQFVPGETLDKSFNYVKPYSKRVLNLFTNILKDYIDEVILRI